MLASLFKSSSIFILGSAEETGTLSKGWALGLFFVTIVIITVVAVTWTWYVTDLHLKHPDEQFVSARNTQKWWGIGASYFSAALGTWVLSGPPEVGQQYGWWGIIGYSFTCALPWLFMAIFGAKMRKVTAGKGFTCVDYVKTRMGTLFHIFYCIVCIGFIWGSLITEAVTIGSIYSTISPGINPLTITLCVAATTLIYTVLGGMMASFLTDRLQFVAIMILTVIGMGGIFGYTLPQVSSEAFKEVANWTGDGFVSAIVLNVACVFPMFMDPANWTRIYASESIHSAQMGLLFAGIATIIPLLFFGVCGALGQAAFNSGVITVDPTTFSPVFALLTIVPSWLSGMMLVFATCLSMSTVDSYISGIATCIAGEIKMKGWNYNWARVFATGLFIPAVILAAFNPPAIMTVFMALNLVSTATSTPMILMLWPIVTPIGAFSGIILGFLTICAFGWGYGGTFKSGFTWFLLPTGYDWWALATFIVCWLVSMLGSLGISQLEFMLVPGSKEREEAKFLKFELEESMKKQISLLSAVKEEAAISGIITTNIDDVSSVISMSDITGVSSHTNLNV